jgi:hypothetical protein
MSNHPSAKIAEEAFPGWKATRVTPMKPTKAEVMAQALREIRARTYSSDKGCALEAKPVAEICEIATKALNWPEEGEGE